MRPPIPLRPHPELLVLAADARGLSVRVLRSAQARCIPAHIEQDPVFQEALTQFAIQSKARGWFDGVGLPVVAIEGNNTEFVLHCAQDRYSRGQALTAWTRKQFEAGLEPPIFPLEFAPGANTGVDIALITSDHKVFVNKRSERMAKAPGQWMLGFGEGLEPSDLDTPDLRATCSRGLSEELALPLDLMAIPGVRFTTVALVREAPSHTWNSYCIVDLRNTQSERFSHRQILEQMASARDAWESEAIKALAPEQVPEFFATVKTVPGAVVCSQLLLQYIQL